LQHLFVDALALVDHDHLPEQRGRMIFLSRSEIERSMIRATATTEASSRNQIGHPLLE